MISNHQLADFCRKAAKLKTRYMWGTYGQDLTIELVNQKVDQYSTNRYSFSRQEVLKDIAKYKGGYKACDCVGLIKWALWTDGDIAKKPLYHSKTDRNVGMLRDDATECGYITTIPDQEGVIVWKADHVGVYLGGGKVAECTLGSRGDGVVITALGKAGWTHWIKIPEIMYCPIEKGDRITSLKNMLKGLLGL